jgi:thiamine pyrophosphate-dependent acetolactate synthase large subunit-like protein
MSEKFSLAHREYPTQEDRLACHRYQFCELGFGLGLAMGVVLSLHDGRGACFFGSCS